MKTINSNEPIPILNIDIAAEIIIPTEIYARIFSFAPVATLLPARLACKKFNDLIVTLEYKKFFAIYGNHVQTIDEYRKLVDQIQKTYNQKEISTTYFNKLLPIINASRHRIGCSYAEKKDHSWHATINLFFGLIFLFTSFAFFSDSYPWQNCLKEFRDLDLTACQIDIDKIVFNDFINKVLIAAPIGSLIKAMDHGIAYLIQSKHLYNDILLELPLAQPITGYNKIFYLMWRILQYRDLPVLAIGFGLSWYFYKFDTLHADISPCIDKDSYGFDKVNNDCLITQTNHVFAELRAIAITQGSMYGYAMLGMLYLFFKFLEAICKQTKNIFHASYKHLFFNRAPQNNGYLKINLIEDEETPSLSTARFS